MPFCEDYTDFRKMLCALLIGCTMILCIDSYLDKHNVNVSFDNNKLTINISEVSSCE